MPYLTTNKIAQRFNVSQRTVRNWISKGLIPAVKVGKKWMVEESGLKNSVITDNEIQKIVREIINKSIGFKR
jgi:excisionase family DNA binding protein